jgi:hypothetical protein
MSYCVYMRDGKFLSLFEEAEGIWLHLTAGQRQTLLHTLEADGDYQWAVVQYPRTTLIEVQLDVLPWEAAYLRHRGSSCD